MNQALTKIEGYFIVQTLSVMISQTQKQLHVCQPNWTRSKLQYGKGSKFS